MLWDIFCKVIDNFGDIGVCWRLSADLAQRGHAVRLWADDPSALAWMAPGALQGQHPGVQVRPWAQSQDAIALAKLPPADVWIEAFGCDIAHEFIANYAMDMRASDQNNHKPPLWVNLEYLSAEAYVERAHALPSPVMSGPAKGWTKHFFYPGFSARTGGLLREPGLAARQAAFNKADWLARQGIAWQGEPLVSLFCYEPPALGALLDQLASAPQPTQLLVTFGRASVAVRGEVERKTGQQPSWNNNSSLLISYLPPLDQTEFDHLLWACDLNFVRGEDSLVRALWAGAAMVWQIYPQDDGAHAPKLEAWMDRLSLPPDLRQFHRAWNGLMETMPPTPPPLNPVLWRASLQVATQGLRKQDDLASALIQFAIKNR
jgi:uncharacterized repeat protein (TIGR03837 family)